MEIERSSSIDLSSAPGSDTEPQFTSGYPNHSSRPHPISDLATTAASGVDQTNTAGQVKKPRKRVSKPKVESDAPKPARKPRASNGSGPASRKRPKVEDSEAQPRSVTASTGLQGTSLVQPYTFDKDPAPSVSRPEVAKYPQNGILAGLAPMQHTSTTSQSPHHSAQPSCVQHTPPRATSMYDPIRGSLTDTSHVSSLVSHTPPQPISRSGASPIANLIEPPAPSTHSPLRSYVTPSEPSQPDIRPASPPATMMDIDQPSDSKPTKKSSAPPTRITSPKPAPKAARAKEQPPPAPAGLGLLGGFGGELGLADKSNTNATGPNIVLQIDLKDPKNKVINFARLAEEKYGFAALYPRQAAQRERLARVAAAGAAIERSASNSKFNSAGESGDDEGSVDIDRESDNDGDVAMGGVNGEANSGTDANGPKKKRRKRDEEYDLADDFVDDTEQVWELQAATTKDGFFVFCGPLVREGEKPNVERYVSICIFPRRPTNYLQSRWYSQSCARRPWSWPRWWSWQPWRERRSCNCSVP